jgi:hypothetical protein
MAPRTSPYALVGIGAVALGVGGAQLFAVLLLTRYLALVGVACGAVGAVLGLLGLGQIARNPKRFEGRPMAIAAVILGTLEVLGYGAFFLVRAGILLPGLY